MVMRFLSLFERMGRQERDRIGGRLRADGAAASPPRMIGTMLGAWLWAFRPSRLLRLVGACALALSVVYMIGFRSAESWAVQQAGPGASAERLHAVTLERLRLKSCSGLSRTSCWPPQGSYTLYRHFGSFGTLAILGFAGAGCFMLGWGLGRRARG